MTIPVLIQNTQEKVAAAKLKKTYSTLENAYRMAVNEFGTPDNWDLGTSGFDDQEGRKNMIEKITPYLSILNNCGENQGCFADVTYKYLKGTNYDNFDKAKYLYKILLADGTSIGARIHSGDCSMVVGSTKALSNVCGSYNIDINGIGKPNTLGKDFHSFWLTKYGVIPFGTQGDTLINGWTFEGGCKDKNTADGHGCTAWVIYNGNMDYLHCNDLSWNGKKKCTN